MGRHTYYTLCETPRALDGDSTHVRIELPPKTVSGIFTARDKLRKLRQESPEIRLTGLRLESTAEFGRLPAVEYGNRIRDMYEARVLTDELSAGLFRERRWWADRWEEHWMPDNHLIVTEYGIDWFAGSKDDPRKMYTDAGWWLFEDLALRYGLVTLVANDDVRNIAASVLDMRTTDGLPVLADALQEVGNPEWVPNRLRGIANRDDVYGGVEWVFSSTFLKGLAAQPKRGKKDRRGTVTCRSSPPGPSGG